MTLYRLLMQEVSKKIFRWLFLTLVLIILGSNIALHSDSQYLILLLFASLGLICLSSFEWGLYILVGSLPFSFRFIMKSGTEMQVPTEPLLAIMAVTFLTRQIIMHSKGVVIKFPLLYPILGYMISLCLSLINAEQTYACLKAIVRALAYSALSIVTFYAIDNRDKLKRLFLIALLPATVAVGWTLIFLIDRLSLWRWSSAYEGLPFTSYSHYGSFVGVILLILLARSIFDKGIYDRTAWTALLSFYIVAMCFCFSRGAWLGVLVSIGFMLLQRDEGIQLRKFLFISVGIALILILLSIPTISNIVMSRLGTILNFRYGSNRERLLRWGVAILMFIKSPIVGSGYGSFAFSYINNPEILGFKSRFQMGAHNEYLQILAETGIIGFATWIWIIVAFYRYGLNLLNKLKGEGYKDASFWRSIVIGIMAAETSLLVHFIVNNLIQADIVGIPFWLLIGLLPTVGRLAESEKSLNNA